jgi:trigger factor
VNTSVETLSPARVKINAEVGADDVNAQIDRAARRLGSEMRMPGFRKGKVPAPLVIQQYGRAAVFEEALREALPAWYESAIIDSGISPVGEPQLDLSDPPGEGEALEFSIEISIRPPAKLGSYKGIEVGQPEPEVPEGAVEAEIDRLRESMASLQAVERTAADGDHLLVDFTGSVDGEEFEGGQASDYLLELGSGSFIPGFEEGLIGAEAGEERTVEVKFPDDYHAEHLAGADASFAVTVKEVREKTLPEADDDFAADNSDFDTLEELRADIEHRILHAMEHRVEDEYREAVLDAVVEQAEIELPDDVVAARAEEVWERLERQLQGSGMDPAVYLQMQGKTREEAIEEAKPDAEKGLRREAVLEAVAEAEDIEVSEGELLEALRPPAGQKGKPEKLLKRIRAEGRDALLIEEIRMRKAADLVVDEAKAIEMDRAEAREKLWTPEAERDKAGAGGSAGKLWTPGDPQ